MRFGFPISQNWRLIWPSRCKTTTNEHVLYDLRCCNDVNHNTQTNKPIICLHIIRLVNLRSYQDKYRRCIILTLWHDITPPRHWVNQYLPSTELNTRQINNDNFPSLWFNSPKDQSITDIYTLLYSLTTCCSNCTWNPTGCNIKWHWSVMLKCKWHLFMLLH